MNEEIKNTLMHKLADKIANPPKVGEMIEGPIVAIDKASIYIDLNPFGTGIIYGREFLIARDMIRKVHVGDMVTAKIVDMRNEDGYLELSLKEAKQAIIWGEVEEAIKNKTALELVVQEANKGGLLMTWQGVQGFLPASQLNADHYPRVTDGDKMKILEELRRLVGQKLVVTIIGATPDDGKLIFSEKGVNQEQIENIQNEQNQEAIKKYEVGDILDGEVTGVVDFGIFVKVDNSMEGLVHISEIDWSLVEDPRNFCAVGDKIKVKIIEVKDDKISLSIKALKENPWSEAEKKYKKGDIVKGIIIKYNKHGALASIQEGVAGLIHVSEFPNEENLRETLELGKIYDFRINLFDPKEQRMTLSTKLVEEKK
jgi:small subunit ribosomal protein S1